MADILSTYHDTISNAIYVLLFVVVLKVFHQNPAEILHGILQEAREFATLRFDVGALNFLLLILLTVVAIFIIMSREVEGVFEKLASLVGTPHAKEFGDGATPVMLFVIAISGLFSLKFVARVQRERQAKKKK